MLYTSGGYNIFILKLDRNGNLVWAKNVGGREFDSGNGIDVDHAGNIYATGYFRDTVDFDPNAGIYPLISHGQRDIFIQKLDKNGNLLWAKGIGEAQNDIGYSLQIDDSSNVYVTGNFTGLVDFDPNAGTANLFGNGAFVLKLDRQSNFIWTKSTNNTQGLSIALDDSNGVFTTGYYDRIVDFNPNIGIFNLPVSGHIDIYIQKLKKCSPSIQVDTRIAYCSYTWIDGNIYHSSTKSPIHSIIGGAQNGCDSIMSLNLTIDTIITTVNTGGSTITANESNALYQWLDCNNNLTVIQGETSQSYIVSKNGNYAVQITINDCIDTSICTSITNVKIERNALDNQISISPNPNKGFLQIKLSKKRPNTQIQIFNGIGKLVYQGKLDHSINQISLLHISPGIYQVCITFPNKEPCYKKVEIIR